MVIRAVVLDGSLHVLRGLWGNTVGGGPAGGELRPAAEREGPALI